MQNPTIGDILRVAVEQQLPVQVRWKGGDDQQWYSFDRIDRAKAADICLNATGVRITFFMPE